MVRKRLLIACLLLTMAAAGPAFARDCAKVGPWECYTEVTFEEDDFKLHLIVFGNDEMMGEIERDGRLRRMIAIGANRPPVYAGLTPEEMRHATPLHFMIPAPQVARILMTAFPGGPASVPSSPRTVSYGGEKITASRDAAGVIHYALDSRELGKASGLFSVRKMLPLADDYPIGEWQLADGRHLKRLGELRSGAIPAAEPAPRPAPPLALRPDVSTYPVVAAPASGPTAVAVRAQAHAAAPAASQAVPSSR